MTDQEVALTAMAVLNTLVNEPRVRFEVDHAEGCAAIQCGHCPCSCDRATIIERLRSTITAHADRLRR